MLFYSTFIRRAEVEPFGVGRELFEHIRSPVKQGVFFVEQIANPLGEVMPRGVRKNAP